MTGCEVEFCGGSSSSCANARPASAGLEFIPMKEGALAISAHSMQPVPQFLAGGSNKCLHPWPSESNFFRIVSEVHLWHLKVRGKFMGTCQHRPKLELKFRKMDELISPKYQMKLAKSVHDAIWEEYKTYKEVKLYIKKWHNSDYNGNWENFEISYKENKEIDLQQTLHNMSGVDLLKVAIDLGVDTPDFIPSIPTFKNELKSDYKTAYDTFTKAYKQIETDPSVAIGLANSALESIIKEILKDSRISSKITGGETLYKLTSIILKEFNFTNEEHPKEIKTMEILFWQ